MKKEWVQPRADVMEFVANEYVAACYEVSCDVPVGWAFEDLDKDDYRDSNEPMLPGSEGCGGKHIIKDKPFYNASWALPGSDNEWKDVYHFTGKFEGFTGEHHYATSWTEVNAS